jgi:hypothetical protein
MINRLLHVPNIPSVRIPYKFDSRNLKGYNGTAIHKLSFPLNAGYSFRVVPNQVIKSAGDI